MPDHFRVGVCISSHGFGHATRAIAVMTALAQRVRVSFEIVTTVPQWLFAQSMTAPFALHAVETDVGLVQQSALVEDLDATLDRLDGFLPLHNDLVERTAGLLTACQLVLCDISPLGIAAAARLGIPSVLIENFTWDWIYASYADRYPRFLPYIHLLAAQYAQADHHIQVAPVCRQVTCSLVADPVARPLRRPEAMREVLAINRHRRLVLLTMGGLGAGDIALDPLRQREEAVFVLTGWDRNAAAGNLRFLARDAPWYHPDLVAAADLVVGKLGYSTVAEVCQAGVPFVAVGRPGFRETASLAGFAESRLGAWCITGEALADGSWLAAFPHLPAGNDCRAVCAGGADQVAAYLDNLLIS